jgi:hypothetical protein
MPARGEAMGLTKQPAGDADSNTHEPCATPEQLLARSMDSIDLFFLLVIS